MTHPLEALLCTEQTGLPAGRPGMNECANCRRKNAGLLHDPTLCYALRSRPQGVDMLWRPGREMSARIVVRGQRVGC